MQLPQSHAISCTELQYSFFKWKLWNKAKLHVPRNTKTHDGILITSYSIAEALTVLDKFFLYNIKKNKIIQTIRNRILDRFYSSQFSSEWPDIKQREQELVRSTSTQLYTVPLKNTSNFPTLFQQNNLRCISMLFISIDKARDGQFASPSK